MPYHRLFADAREIKIEWGRPCELKDIEKDKACQTSMCLYKIVGRYNNKYKLFYIGKSEARCVWKRLREPDHREKQDAVQKVHSHHRLLVSVGTVNCEVDVQTLRNIEQLLIYAHGANQEFQRFINKKSIYSHRISVDYTIENLGFKGDGMYREIGLGMYYRK